MSELCLLSERDHLSTTAERLVLVIRYTPKGRQSGHKMEGLHTCRAPRQNYYSTFIRSNYSLGRPLLYSPSPACRVVPIKTPYFSKGDKFQPRGNSFECACGRVMVKKVGKYEIGRTLGEGTFGKCARRVSGSMPLPTENLLSVARR